VDELVRAEFLVADGDRYRVENEAWRDVVSKALAPEAQQELHARLARLFESTGKVNRRAFHLMRSGDAKSAALVLLAHFIEDPNEPHDPLEDYIPGALDFLEEMADASDELDIDAPCKVELRMKTLGASQFVGDIRRTTKSSRRRTRRRPSSRPSAACRRASTRRPNTNVVSPCRTRCGKSRASA
jgi:hypothetical protein